MESLADVAGLDDLGLELLLRPEPDLLGNIPDHAMLLASVANGIADFQGDAVGNLSNDVDAALGCLHGYRRLPVGGHQDKRQVGFGFIERGSHVGKGLRHTVFSRDLFGNRRIDIANGAEIEVVGQFRHGLNPPPRPRAGPRTRANDGDT